MSLKDKLANKDIKEVLSTPQGKGVAAGLLLVIVLLVVAVVGTFAIPKSGKDDTDTVVTTETTGSPETTGTPNASKVATGTPETTGTAKATTETAAEETETVLTKYDLSGYKDPFKPLFSAAEINNGTTTDGSNVSNTSNTSSTNQSTSNPVTSNVDSHQLSLVRIVDQNGQRYATVSYQGQEYTVKEGDQIAGSPFKVTDIGDGSITLLYGDDRLTLQLGDEIIK